MVLGLLAGLAWWKIDERLNGPAVQDAPIAANNVTQFSANDHDQKRTEHDEYQDLMMLGLAKKLEAILVAIDKLDKRLHTLEKSEDGG
jgi:hypothetical protein